MPFHPSDLAIAFVHDVDRLPEKSTPHVRRLRRQLSKTLASAQPSDVYETACVLIDHGLRWAGYEIIHDHPETMASLRLKDVVALGSGMAAWDHVDTFACLISGPSWRSGRISDAAVRRWTTSPSRWWRRAALVSTVPLNVKSQGGTGDVPRTLDICGRLAADHDDMVEKALSWALRCLVQHDPRAARDFLDRHEEELGARVLREVKNKLLTGLKNRKTPSAARKPRDR